MKLSYLIDTDWVIHYLNGNEKIVEKLTSFKKKRLAISVISLAELYEGVYYSRDPTGNEQALRDFLAGVSVLGINEEICKIFGKERDGLRKKGRIIGDFDLLIAPTCIYYDLIVLTNNRKHYEVVEGLKIISV